MSYLICATPCRKAGAHHGAPARAMAADAPFFSLPELVEGGEKNGAGANSATARACSRRLAKKNVL